MLDVLRDFDCLPLVAEVRQNLDKAAQKRVTRKQQEEKYQNRLQETRGEGAGVRKYSQQEACADRRARGRAGGRVRITTT